MDNKTKYFEKQVFYHYKQMIFMITQSLNEFFQDKDSLQCAIDKIKNKIDFEKLDDQHIDAKSCLLAFDVFHDDVIEFSNQSIENSRKAKKALIEEINKAGKISPDIAQDVQ